LIFVLVLFLFLFHCSSPRYNHFAPSAGKSKGRRKGRKEAGERSARQGTKKKKKESVKAKVFIMRQWLGEAYKRPAKHQSQRIAAHTHPKLHTHVHREK